MKRFLNAIILSLLIILPAFADSVHMPHRFRDPVSQTYVFFDGSKFVLQKVPLTNSYIFVGNASNVATGVPLSGDATISNTGVLSVNNISSGTVPIARGGTNNGSLGVSALALVTGDGSKLVQTSNGTPLQQVRINAGGTAIEWFTAGGSGAVDSITGTANQIVASSPTGDITLSLASTLGSVSVPFSNIYLGSGGANKSASFDTSALSADRVITVPNAASTTVVPDTGAANNFLTAISASGAISKAQPAYSDLSGNGSTNIITLGTITTGTWTGTDIAVPDGGTGASTLSAISLPTGAAIAAKQPALGVAGTASVDVITVQGIASMTPLNSAQSGTWNINNVSGTVSLPTGAATETTLATILTTTAFQARINTLGQKTMANSTPVVLASDHSIIDTNVKNVLFDSFGRLKVANNSTLFESKEDIMQQTHLWHTLLATGGTITYSATTASNSLNVTASNGSRAVRQSKVYSSYRPGKGLTAYMTGVFGSGQANTTKRIGLFDDNNGIFFELSGTTQRVVVRKNASDSNAISSGAWNGNATGIAADWTKAQIFYIQFQWLGVGRIEMGVVIDGIHYPIQYFNNANSVTEVYMQTPNLPVRGEIVNTAGAAGASSLIMICSAIFLEGHFEKIGSNFSCNNSTTTRSMGTASILPVLMLRPKSTVLHPAFILRTLDIVATTLDNLYYELNLNPTLTGATGPTWNSVHADSYLEFDVACTQVMSAGTLISSGYLNSQTRQIGFPELGENLNLLSTDLAGTRDFIALGMRNFTGTSLVIAAFNWMEFS